MSKIKEKVLKEARVTNEVRDKIVIPTIDLTLAEVEKEVEDIIEDCVIIKMKDVPEHMVGIDLTWLDKEIGKIKNKLNRELRKMSGENDW